MRLFQGRLQKAWPRCDEPAWAWEHMSCVFTGLWAWLTTSWPICLQLCEALPPSHCRTNHINITVCHGTPEVDGIKGNESHTVALENNPKRLSSKRTENKTRNQLIRASLLCSMREAFLPLWSPIPHLIWSHIASCISSILHLLHYDAQPLHASYWIH